VGERAGLHVSTNSMKQGPSGKRSRFSAGQEISRILWNPNVHYRFHKSPPPVPILSQINADHSRIPLTEDPFEYYTPIYTWVLQVVSFHRVSPLKPCMYICSPPCVLRSLDISQKRQISCLRRDSNPRSPSP